LIGKAIDGRRLAECEPKADGIFQTDAMGGHGFFHQQTDETAAAGMRPDIRMQQVAQCFAAFEGDLTLPDPVENRITPLPMRNQTQVLIGEIQGKVELTLFENTLLGRRIAENVVGFHKPGGHVHDL